MDSKLQQKLEKIYNLATRGIAGEQESARKMLEDLLKKNDLTVEDLIQEIEQEQWYEFTYYNEAEAQLLVNIYGRELNTNKMKFTKKRDRKRRMKIKLTPSQHARILKRYNLLKKVMKVELARILDAAQTAFMDKNNLLGDPDPDKPNEDPGFDLEVFARLAQIMPSVADPDVRRISHE